MSDTLPRRVGLNALFPEPRMGGLDPNLHSLLRLSELHRRGDV
jgi:hypothetical protein